jgi:hypothetical protein
MDVITACVLKLGPVSDAAWTFLRLVAGVFLEPKYAGLVRLVDRCYVEYFQKFDSSNE